MEKTKKTKKQNIRAITITAVMSAAAYVLMMLDFSIPIMPSFIKLDFSELPALITAFAFGPLWGVLVCFIKNLVHLFFTSTMAIGEISNFVLGAIFVGVAGLVYKRKKTVKTALLSCVIGSVAMAVISVFSNYFIVYPLYYTVLGMPEAAILNMYQIIRPSTKNLFEAMVVFNLPFNLCKGLIDSVLCFIVYKRLSPALKKQ